MKINKVIVLVLVICALAFAVTSQSPQSKISVEELKACSTNFYDEVQAIFIGCIHYYNYTHCLNSSGPNSDCLLQQNQINSSCRTGETIVTKNSTECKSLGKFIVSFDHDSSIQKKEVDFSNWGVCVSSTENGCLIITCGTLKGGSARNGVFNGCDGGKACQKFLFCQDGIKILQKASRKDFVEADPTYNLPELAVKGVGQ